MSVFAPVATVGMAELVVICLLMLAMAVVPVLVIFWFARKMVENGRENTRLRLEVSKLAHELEQTRKPQA
jgi:hypothetical protein